MSGSSGATITALATAPHPAGVAVVRISGSRVKAVAPLIFRSKSEPLKNPRRMIFGEIVNPVDGSLIDSGVAVFMPGPNSFTGEDVLELHLHGSPLISQKVLRLLYAEGITPAEPGEFTKRAFLNGKIDLAQAEAIADVIEAKSEQALRIAQEQLQGRLSKALDEVGEPLRDLLAELEASIDFPEEDIEPQKLGEMSVTLDKAAAKVSSFLEGYKAGAMIKEGVRVLLCGRPNAGKSSVLNRILGKKRAIVSEIAGTTRDVIEESVSLEGLHFIFCDSAGIRETDDVIEKIGVELARERVCWADIILLVAEASDNLEILETIRPFFAQGKKIWLLSNKIDRLASHGNNLATPTWIDKKFLISAETGEGFSDLITALVGEVQNHSGHLSERSEIITTERHKNCFDKAQAALMRCKENLMQAQPLEIISADLREALGALDEIIGRTYTEDILGRIFSKFCIGK